MSIWLAGLIAVLGILVAGELLVGLVVLIVWLFEQNWVGKVLGGLLSAAALYGIGLLFAAKILAK